MKLKYQFETMKLDDQVVAVPVGGDPARLQSVIKMNGSAAEIFQMLEQDTSEAEIVANLMKEYRDSSAEEIQEYVHSFLSVLSEKDVLETT